MDLDSCEPGTRVHVIQHIKQWGNESTTQRQVFWLSGTAGSGKTTIAATIYKEWENSGCLGGRFFFSQDDVAASTTNRFCVAIAQDVAAHVPSLQLAIAAAIKNTPSTHFPLEIQFQRIVIEPLESYKEPIFLVVDGLDSVPNPHARQRLLLCLITELPKVPNLRVLLSSLSLPDIEEVLGDSDLVEHHIIRPLDATNGEIDPDIILYIERRLKNLIENKDGRGSRADAIASLSRGSFLWLVPATFLLKKNRTGSELMDKLTGIDPTNHLDGLHSLYLGRVTHKMWPPALKMDLIRILMTTFEPMSLATIRSFLPCETRDADGLKALVYQLRGLLKGVDSNISVRHRSFREFCTDPTRAKEFYVDLAVTHGLLGFSCLALMEPHLRHNFLGIDLKGKVVPTNNQVKNPVKEKLDPAVAYSTSYWPFHVASAVEDQDLLTAAKAFLRTHVLHWIEIMSWRGRIDTVVDGLSCLQVALQSHASLGDGSVSYLLLNVTWD